MTNQPVKRYEDGSAVSMREGYTNGSWGGVAHAVSPSTTERFGSSLCGRWVLISRLPWVPETNGVMGTGHCKQCHKLSAGAK